MHMGALARYTGLFVPPLHKIVIQNRKWYKALKNPKKRGASGRGGGE